MLSKSQSIRQTPVQARALGQVMDSQSSTESCCRPMKILKNERKPELWFVMFGSKQIWSQWLQAQKCLGFPRWFLASQCRWLLCNDVQQEQPSFCDHRGIQWHGRNYFRQQWRLKTARCWAVSVPRELKSSFGVASAVQFADGGICRCEDWRTASCWWSGLMSQKQWSFDSWDAMCLKHAECHGRCWTIWLILTTLSLSMSYTLTLSTVSSRHLEVARRTCGSNFRPNSNTCSMIHCHELLPRNGSPNGAKSCKIYQNPNPLCIERADCFHQKSLRRVLHLTKPFKLLWVLVNWTEQRTGESGEQSKKT